MKEEIMKALEMIADNPYKCIDGCADCPFHMKIHEIPLCLPVFAKHVICKLEKEEQMKKPIIVKYMDDINHIEIYNDRIDFIYDCGYCNDSLNFDKLSNREIDKIIKLLQNVKDVRDRR